MLQRTFSVRQHGASWRDYNKRKGQTINHESLKLLSGCSSGQRGQKSEDEDRSLKTELRSNAARTKSTANRSAERAQNRQDIASNQVRKTNFAFKKDAPTCYSTQLAPLSAFVPFWQSSEGASKHIFEVMIASKNKFCSQEGPSNLLQHRTGATE